MSDCICSSWDAVNSESGPCWRCNGKDEGCEYVGNFVKEFGEEVGCRDTTLSKQMSR